MITEGQIVGEEEAYLSYLQDRTKSRIHHKDKGEKIITIENDYDNCDKSIFHDKKIQLTQYPVRKTTMICNTENAEIWRIPYRVI